MRLFKEIFRLFDRSERWKLAVVVAILVGGSLVEIAGIGLILPFIKIVAEPEFVLRNARWAGWLAGFGVNTPRGVILAACAALFAVTLFKGFYVLVSTRISYRFIYRKMLALQRRVLQGYLRAPYFFHLRENSAGLVRNATIEPELLGGVMKFGMQLPTELLTVAGVLVLMVGTEPITACIGIGTLGLLMWAISARTRVELTRLGKLRAEQQGKTMQWANQALGGIKEVKVLGREAYFLEAFSGCARIYNDALWRSSLIGQYPRVILETFAAVLIVVFVAFVVLTGRDVQSMVGTLALFGMGAVRLVPAASRISTSLHHMRFHGPSVRAVAQAIRTAAAPGAETAPPQPMRLREAIRVEALSYRYPEAAEDSLSEVSLEIPRGACIAFVGSSGAGKTTLANLILGLLEPTAGCIRVDGVDIRENLCGWQHSLGYIPQDSFLTDDTIRRNVAFGIPDAEIDDAAVWRALEAAQLAAFVRGLDAGLDAAVGERGVRISAGQRQRIGIARALYHDPPVLLLDEATSALDNETERLFAAAIAALAGQRTILIIAHRLSTVRDCDTIYCLESGRVAAEGTYDELLATHAAFAQQVHGRQPEFAAR